MRSVLEPTNNSSIRSSWLQARKMQRTIMHVDTIPLGRRSSIQFLTVFVASLTIAVGCKASWSSIPSGVAQARDLHLYWWNASRLTMGRSRSSSFQSIRLHKFQLLSSSLTTRFWPHIPLWSIPIALLWSTTKQSMIFAVAIWMLSDLHTPTWTAWSLRFLV